MGHGKRPTLTKPEEERVVGRAGPGSLGQSELLTGSKSRHSGPSWQREKRNSNVTRLPSQEEGTPQLKGPSPV